MESRYFDIERIQNAVNAGHHREVVGGQWGEIGQLQFDFLKKNGLRTDHSLLDIGCGCLRGGVHFIAYLERDRYVGVDIYQSLLDAVYEIELAVAELQDRLPRGNLMCIGDFSFGEIGRRFDFALAQSLFTHLNFNHVRRCLEGLAEAMEAGGVLFATFFEAPRNGLSSGPYRHTPGDVVTYGAADPYHYRLSDFVYAVQGLPWRVQYIGEWGNPRSQRWLAFHRLPPADSRLCAETLTDQPASNTLNLDVEAALLLPAGADHYRAFVGPPDRYDFMSATQFSLLFALGLRDRHRVLDFGCGSLRLGRLLIPFLQPGCYFGIDPNRWLIDAALERELGDSISVVKRPKFAYNNDFSCTVFGTAFDFIVAQSILTHCGPDIAGRLIGSMAEALAPHGKIIFSIIESPNRSSLPNRMGWIYPDCVSYGDSRITEMCRAAGLHSHRLPWYHPGAVWYIAARRSADLPQARELPALRGAVLFDPQFEASRPAPQSDTVPANPLAPFADHAGAIAAGLSAGVGGATLIAPTVVEAGSFSEFHLVYVAGKSGIVVGGTLRVALRHVCQWSPPQTQDASLPGYTSVCASDGTSFSIAGWEDAPDTADVFHCMFPWQHVIDIKPLDRSLVEGDRVEIVYGDRTGGGPGARVQTFEEASFAFRVYVDPSGAGEFLPLDPDLGIAIVGGEAIRLVLLTPSSVRVGEPTRLLIRAEDRYGNIACSHRGSIAIEFSDGEQVRRQPIDLTEADSGIRWIDGLVFKSPGDYTFTIAGTSCESNPVRVSGTQSRVSTFWGELHGHTLHSDGRGTLDQFYDYACRVAALDVCAVTDHDFMMSDAVWADSKRITNAHNRPGRFVTLQAFEWSGLTEVGGDHNVYFVTDDPPIIRCRSYFDYRNQQTYHGSTVGANHIEDVYNFLTEHCPPGTVFVVPHYGGRPANPKWHRPELERLIEIFSEHQRSESWAAPFRKRGYRLGNIGAGDDHIGRPGYGFLRYGALVADQPAGLGLVGIQAEVL